MMMEDDIRVIEKYRVRKLQRETIEIYKAEGKAKSE